jgi:hypothetical protein
MMELVTGSYMSLFPMIDYRVWKESWVVVVNWDGESFVGLLVRERGGPRRVEPIKLSARVASSNTLEMLDRTANKKSNFRLS